MRSLINSAVRQKKMSAFVLAVVVVTCLFLYFMLRLPKVPRERVEAMLQAVRAKPLAHRGGRPENTLAAILKSKELGASGVEVDLGFSKDGQPVLVHDATVDRTSNGSGRVRDLTLEQLKSMDFGVKTGGPDFAGERIPTLYEAVDLCEKLDLLMFLELKSNPNQSLQVVKKLLSESPHLYSRIAVISFYPHILYKVHHADERLVVGLVTRDGVLSTTTEGSPRNSQCWKHYLVVLLDKILSLSIRTWLWRILGISLILANKNDILSGRMDPVVWEKKGVSLLAWTVNSKEEKNRFQQVLKIPYMTDHVGLDVSVPEQQQ